MKALTRLLIEDLPAGQVPDLPPAPWPASLA